MTAKALLDDVSPGTAELRLSNGVGVGTGLANVLAIDADDASRRELIVVTSIGTPGSASDWVRVRISPPLSLVHRRGAIVRRMQNVPASLSPAKLNYAATRGDNTVLFDMTGVTGAHQIRLVDAGPPIANTFHMLTVFAARTDSQGFYRLPPLARAGKIEVFAQDAGATVTGTVEFVPDYEQPENELDVIVA
jgi:hypothetical protein